MIERPIALAVRLGDSTSRRAVRFGKATPATGCGAAGVSGAGAGFSVREGSQWDYPYLGYFDAAKSRVRQSSANV